MTQVQTQTQKPEPLNVSEFLVRDTYKVIVTVSPSTGKISVAVMKRRGKEWVQRLFLPPDPYPGRKVFVGLPRYVVEALPWLREQPDVVVRQ